MRLLASAIALAVLAGASSARGEIALLANGQTMKVTAHRAEAGLVFLALKDGGEIGVPAADLRGIVPDEVIDEILPAIVQGGDPKDIRALATAAAQRHGLDPELVLAVISVESAFKPDAVSRVGAQGLMQLMPATAKDLGVKDAMDPAENVDGGSRYLKEMIELQGGNLERALAAYNAGPGAVKRHKGVPPYKETRQYVKKVLRRYEQAAGKDAAPSGKDAAPAKTGK
jgi:soluble lytic murein transglycosylase-like protein